MRLLILISLLCFGLAGCASKEKKEVREEMAKSPQIKSENELYNIEHDLLSSTQNLTAEQRNKLATLIQKSRDQNQQMQLEIEKTKAILFKELLSDKGSRSKIRILESQLLKLNKKKTRYSLSTYREAKNIVGKNEVPLEKTLNMLDNRTIHEF